MQTWPVLGPLNQKVPQNQAPRHLLMHGSVVEGCVCVDGLGEVRPEEGSGCHGAARPLRAHDPSTQAQATEVELLRCLCHVPELCCVDSGKPAWLLPRRLRIQNPRASREGSLGPGKDRRALKVSSR